MSKKVVRLIRGDEIEPINAAPVVPSAEAWAVIADRMQVKGLAKQLIIHCVFDRCEGRTVFLLIDEDNRHLVGPRCDALSEALQDALGEKAWVCIGIGKRKVTH